MTVNNSSFGENAPQDFDPSTFVDRRGPAQEHALPARERRQFSDSYEGLSAEAAELGRAIDQYKLMNRRRYITYEEMLSVIQSLGYNKAE